MIDIYYNKARKVVIWALIGNLFLVFIKILIGFIGQSSALVADGMHSLSDFGTDIILLIGLKCAAIPADDNHPYGHSKIEDIASLCMGVVLLTVGLSIGYYAGIKLCMQKIIIPSSLTLSCAFISILIKECMYQYSMRMSKKLHSDALAINAWHQRTDALSSVAVLIGVSLSFIHPSMQLLDPLIALFIALLISHIGLKALWNTFSKLIDTSPPVEYKKKIAHSITSIDGVMGFHELKTRYFGNQILVDVHIQVDGSISVRQGHSIAGKVKYKVKKDINKIKDVLIHIEPASS